MLQYLRCSNKVSFWRKLFSSDDLQPSISDVTRLASSSGLINKGSPPRAVLSSKERVGDDGIAAARRGGLLILISC